MERVSCACGRVHKCDVEKVVVEQGAVAYLDDILSSFQHSVVVADENTYGAFVACGGRLRCALSESVIFPKAPTLVPDELAIDKIKSSVKSTTDVIIGIGGGTVNDLCKYIAHTCNLYYVYVATAPSMDGYASDGAALILGGMKVTLKARPPHVIICDTEILKNAPLELIRGGVGDILGKFSCLNDWLLSAQIKGEYFCTGIYDRVYDCALRVCDNTEKILNRDSEAIAVLTRALVDVGIEMSYAGSSRPASGSEHHLAHFFEIHALEQGQRHQPHGIDVGCASYFTALLREAVIHSMAVPCFSFDGEQHFGKVKALLPRAAEGIMRLQNKTALHGNPKGNFDMEIIKSVLKKAPTAEATKRMLNAAGLPPEKLVEFYGKDLINDALKYGKELKDRFTVLWLYEYLGWEILKI